MSNKVYFVNSVNNEPSYTAEDFTNYFGHFLSDGIVIDHKTGAGFACSFAPDSSPEDVKVIVKPGTYIKSGRAFVFSEAETLSLGAIPNDSYLQKSINISYSSTTKELSYSIDDHVWTGDGFPKTIADVKAWPASSKALKNKIIDYRDNVGYISNILKPAENYKTILETAYNNVDNLLDTIYDNIETATATGVFYTTNIFHQKLTSADFTDNQAILSIADSKQIYHADLYLNGRLGGSNAVFTFDRLTKKITTTRALSTNDTIDAVIFYIKEVDTNA